MTFYRTFFAIALFALPLLAWGVDTDSVRTKDSDVFVVKTAKKLAGAKVEIFSASGQLVTAQMVQSRKVIIDFGNIENGTYTIKITKDEIHREFQYEKK